MGLGLTSGMLYALWLLGYYLNRAAMENLEVSALQSKGQPHYVLFVIGDLVTGAMVMAVSYLTVRIFAANGSQVRGSVWLCAAGLGIFGLLTAVTCLLPGCTGSFKECFAQAGNLLDFHDITGAVAAFGLFLSVVGWLKAVYGKISVYFFGFVTVLLVAWCVSGLALLATSLATVHAMLLVQHVWLLLSSLCLMILPLGLLKIKRPAIQNGSF